MAVFLIRIALCLIAIVILGVASWRRYKLQIARDLDDATRKAASRKLHQLNVTAGAFVMLSLSVQGIAELLGK